MKCKFCGSDNVNIQIINESHLVNAHHSFLWWICIGWLWVLFKWIFFTLPALIFKIFGIGKERKSRTLKKVAVCQTCGKSWNLN